MRKRIITAFIAVASMTMTQRPAFAGGESLSYRGALPPSKMERVEWGRDPFAPLAARGAHGAAAALLTLGAIFYNPARPSALINGRIVYRGSVIDGQKVVDIGKTHVILQKEGGQTRLEFVTEQGAVRLQGRRDGRR